PNSKNLEVRQRALAHVDQLVVATRVWRLEKEAGIHQEVQRVEDHTFCGFVVFEFEPYPEAWDFRVGREKLHLVVDLGALETLHKEKCFDLVEANINRFLGAFLAHAHSIWGNDISGLAAKVRRIGPVFDETLNEATFVEVGNDL